MSNSAFWNDFKEVNAMLKKQAFIQMPGGNKEAQMAGDPAAGGMPPPGDPAAMGMPPGGDPAAMGMPPPGDPAAMGMPPPGMDPAAAGGVPMDPSMMPPPGVDPAMMGMPPAPGAAPEAAPGSPMITISLDQLFEIIQKVLGLAKKVGVNGSGVQQPAPEAQGISQDQLKATIYEALGQMAG